MTPRHFFATIVCSLAALTAGSAADAQGPRPANSTSIAVDVRGGGGSGNFDSSRTLHVWADPPPGGSVFDRWSGDTDALENAADAHTRILTSSTRTSVAVAATYRPAPAATPTSEPFNNGFIRYSIPPGPLRGVITLHHGSGGSSLSWFVRDEQPALVRDAVARGYAVLALDSVDRVNKQWSTQFSADNPDVVNTLDALRLLTSRGLLPSGLARFALGMSNGGGFVARMALFGGYAGANAYCAAAGNAGGSRVPITWNMALSDGNEKVGPAGNAAALANFNVAIANGVSASYARQAPSPVHPRRFLRVSGLSPDDSQNIYNAIKGRGFLDASDFLTAPPSASGVINAIPSAYQAQAAAILDQLEVCWADHQFYADANRRSLDFFDNPNEAAARQTPLVVNLSTRAPTLSGDDVLIGGFIVQGASGTTQRLLVRAIGPSLLAHGVAGALTDPELQIFDDKGQSLATNGDWRTGPQRDEIIAAGLAPTDEREAAVVLQLPPGAYTAIVRGTNNATGITVVEAYNLVANAPARLANVSTRAPVGRGDNVMIAGFIVRGLDPKRMLFRAVGPSLVAAGVPRALADPEIELRDSAGQLLARNGDWAAAQEQEIRAAALPPPSSVDAALIATLAPGSYTLVVRGKNESEGNAVVEAYEFP